MNQDGSHRVCLTPNSDTDYHPALSPDGTTIAFTTHRDGMRALYLMKSDGTDPRRLTNNMAEDRQPSFTMDSRQILFHSNRAGKFEIYAVDLATQKEHRLATEMKDTGDVITLGRSHVVSTAESK